MTRVKICGVSTLPDARAAADAGAWAIGVNFWPKSRRFVDTAAAKAIADELGGSLPVVGVFVDADRSHIEEIVRRVPLDMIQLHGDESPEDCDGWGVPVIKAIRVRDRSTWEEAVSYPAEYLLADAFVPGAPGGTGVRVGTDLLGEFGRDRLVLAGGLDPDNVAEAIRSVRPFAVDVASGVESAPGRKDHDKIERFIRNAHAA